MRSLVQVLLLLPLCGAGVVAQQWLVPTTRTTPPDLTRTSTTWTVTSDGETTPTSVVGSGPTRRLQAPTAPAAARGGQMARGTYTVHATFRSIAGATGAYGFVLGPIDGTRLEFLVRPDRTWAIVEQGETRVMRREWTPLDEGTLERTGHSDALDVQVGGAEARFLVNGRTVATVPMSPGSLDGPPGVRLLRGAEVIVAGFTLERAVEARR
jgi:hypothetical protein